MTTATPIRSSKKRKNQPVTIPGLFEEQVRKTPDDPAVIVGRAALNYRELNERANQLAWKLRSLNAGPGVLVGVAVERSFEMVVGLLGVLKSGAAYVPIDPAYPAERVAYMLQDTRVQILLSQEHIRQNLPALDARILCLDSEWQSEIGESRRVNLDIEVRDTDLAYVIYTSGSTGLPKGAMNTHRGISNRLQWMQQAYDLLSDDRVLQKTPFSFDVSVWEFFWPLITGAQLIVAKPGGHQDSGYLVKMIQQHDITTVHFVPSMLKVFLEEPSIGNCRSLRRVICSGEALSIDLKERFFAMLGCELHNLYGPTEAAVDVTFWQCRKNDQAETVPIGYPIANTRIQILDEEMRPVEAGAPGEIHIGGTAVGRGYWRRPELTAEKFVPNPFSATDGERLYRTGDLGRFRKDGAIEYLGRMDLQVKIKGFRIELGEIEAALLRHDSVSDAVVTSRESKQGDRYLAAYVVPRMHCDAQGNGSVASRLRQHLRRHLPEYMVPSLFLVQDELPLSPNGKVDRRALREPEEGLIRRRAAYIEPKTEVEKKLAEIWEAVLQVDKVGLDDDFFELGGHSLLATQLLARLREKLEVDLPVPALFANSTIAKLGQVVVQATGASARSEGPRPVPRNGRLPLSFSQERVWFVDRTHPGNLAYNFQASLQFEGKLSVLALERALQEIIRRHEIFRTTCRELEGRPVQAIHEPYPIKLGCIDLRKSDDPESEARTLIQQELQKSFDLEQLPLIYWKLYRLRSDTYVLLHKEHHLVHDGWSFNLFLDELFELYRAYSSGVEPRLQDLPIQFADFSLWQRQWMTGVEALRQLDFWKQKLANCPRLLVLPWDFARPPEPSYKGKAPRLEIPLDLCAALREQCREQKITLFVAMYTAFVVLLHRMSGEHDICVGSGIANRRWKETECVIGMVVNNIVLRSGLSGKPTLRALLQQTKELVLEASANQDVPFDKVVEALHPKRDPSINPLFQVMFSFHDSPISDFDLPEARVELTETLSNRSAKWDMNIIAIPRAEQKLGHSRNENTQGITVVWEYSSDLFREDTMQRWTGIYLNLLRHIASGKLDQQVDRLPLVTRKEQQELLVDYVVKERSEIEATGSIGEPVSGTQVYVLDPNMEPVPPGVVGELYISEESIRGYDGSSRITAERLLPNPFGVKSGGRLYRTGDLARYQVDNILQRLSKIDREAVTETPLSQGADKDSRELLQQDQNQNEEPEESRRVAPLDEVEQILANVWTDLLQVDSIGTHESFFEAGGHSLLLMRMVSAVNASFGVKLAMREVLSTPTVANLSRMVRRALRRAETADKPILRRNLSDVPASFAQRRLWFMDDLGQESSFYNMPVAYRLLGDLDLTALQASVNEIVRRHEILRTRFCDVEGEATQVIEPVLNVPVEIEDLSDASAKQRERILQVRLYEEARRTFDLKRVPLLRLRLFRIAPEEQVLLIVMHHIISDGWSLGIFYGELKQLYAASRAGTKFTTKPLPVQYADYAVWQRDMLEEGKFDEDLRYWTKKLAGAPELLELNSSAHRPERPTYVGRTERFELNEETTEALKNFSLRTEVTLHMTLLAAYALLLHRASGQEEVIIGVPVANRCREPLEELIGFFVNMLPVRVDVSRQPTFQELACRVKGTALEGYAHQEFPFERLVEELKPGRTLYRNPVFQVVFNMLTPSEGPCLPGITSTPVDVDINSAKVDLYLEVEEHRGKIRGRMIQSSDIFPAGSGKDICSRFQKLIEQVLANEECAVGKFDLLLENERLSLQTATSIEDLEESFLL